MKRRKKLNTTIVQRLSMHRGRAWFDFQRHVPHLSIYWSLAKPNCTLIAFWTTSISWQLTRVKEHEFRSDLKQLYLQLKLMITREFWEKLKISWPKLINAQWPFYFCQSTSSFQTECFSLNVPCPKRLSFIFVC